MPRTLRGTRVARRAEGDVDPADRTRIDVLWSFAFTLPWADPLVSSVCHARHVLLALSTGDPMLAGRALGMEAVYTAASSFAAWPRAERILAAARAEAARSGDAYASAMVRGCEGVCCCVSMHFERSVETLKEAVSAFRLHCPGSAYEIAMSHFYLFVALAYSMHYDQLRPMLERAVADADERGDRHAGAILRLGVLNSTWIYFGDAARARRDIEVAQRTWQGTRFHTAHYHAVIAEGYLDLFEGEYARAYAMLHGRLPALRRSLLLQMQAYRAEFTAVRGRVALAKASTEQGARREELLREGEGTIREVSLLRGALGRVNVRTMRANIAALRGRLDDAKAILEELAADDAGDAWLSRQCARMLLGRLRGDAVLVRLGEQELAASGGVADPRLTRLYFPAFDAIDPR
jgi:hypothetical protein